MDKRIFLPFYIKAIIIISDLFVIWSFLIFLPLILLYVLEIPFGQKIDLTIIFSLTLMVLGFIRSFKRIKIIEDSTAIQEGTSTGEIVLFDSNTTNRQKILFRLTVELKKSPYEKSIVKNYYFINNRIAKNKYDYSFIFNLENPKELVLINLFPKLVRNYIKKAMPDKHSFN